MSEKLGSNNLMTNRYVKKLLIDYFGGQICFTYPTNQRISQIFFSYNADQCTLVETLRTTKHSQYLLELKSEFMKYDFALSNSYCDPRDVKISMENCTSSRPPCWMEFLKYLFSGRIIFDSNPTLMLKLDTLYQIIYFTLHSGRRPTPMHVSLAQTVHNLSRSKILIEILSTRSLCCSYSSMKKIDNQLVERTISRANNNRVPVPPVVVKNQPINGAMDNFDHIECILSGKGTSHDTVLTLFQNVQKINALRKESETISHKISVEKVGKLKTVLECQKIIHMGPVSKRGSIPADYNVSNGDFNTPFISTTSKDYLLWALCRQHSRLTSSSENIRYVPTFTAVRSTFSKNLFHPTTTAFVPILPYKATEYDSIYTTMINFQDVIKQESQDYGGLWCDKGVYRLAEEIQFLKSDQFNNLFLGLGGFHFEKIVYGCLGSFLEPSGISSILVKLECFGSSVIDSVMGGKDYVRSKKGLSSINEAILNLMFCGFMSSSEYSEVVKMPAVDDRICNNYESWEKCRNELSCFKIAFDKFVERRCTESKDFEYWHSFVAEVFPIALSLTQSLRKGDWKGYVASIRCCLPLFFAFNKTNYARWYTIFYEDSMVLEEHFLCSINRTKWVDL